jgi:hypothetical protein
MHSEHLEQLEQESSGDRELHAAFDQATTLFTALRDLEVLGSDKRKGLMDLGILIQNVLQQELVRRQSTGEAVDIDDRNGELLSSAAKSLNIALLHIENE